MEKYEWVIFYREVAEKLLQYKNWQPELVQIVKDIFKNTGLKMPKLNEGPLRDIDPFSFYGLFNKQVMTDSMRKQIMQQVKELLHIEAPVPDITEGVPRLNNINATYYHYEPVEEHIRQIQLLWQLFEYAMDFSKEQTKINEERLGKVFDAVIKISGIGRAKLTMGLFWIDPYLYIDLDGINVQFIYHSDVFKEISDQLPERLEDKPDWKTYYSLDQAVLNYLHSGRSEYHNFIELSIGAWKYAQEKKNEKAGVRSWLLAAGENGSEWESFVKQEIISIGWNELGNLSQYLSKDAIRLKLQNLEKSDSSFINDAQAVWEFVHEIKPDDVVYVRKGRKQILGKGIVKSGYEYCPDRTGFHNIRKVNWISKETKDVSFTLPMKTLTRIRPDTKYLGQIIELYSKQDSEPEPMPYTDDRKEYSKQDFLREVYMNEKDYDLITRFLHRKYNLILQGPPGTGKTFCAKRLAYSLMNEIDPKRVELVQFHQSTSYEDFMMGYRPSQTGFELSYGPFYTFCQKARQDPDHDYFFIIDEINRGNLSRIFGELFMLVEADKRGKPIRLLYTDEEFSVPSNVYLIGSMNTADRSLALMDYAMRRRFGFYTMIPAFEQAGFIAYQKSLNSPSFDRLIQTVIELNTDIQSDSALGPGFCIGQSFFCNLTNPSADDLKEIVEFELIPLLQEYWYDSPSTLMRWTARLRDVLS